ncbi:MAG TPA: hypothetical protein VGK49_05805 [Ilumatobacteraceae bacterium]
MAGPDRIRTYGSTRETGIGSEGAAPTAEEVERMHENADVDTRPESIHHTLGPGTNQAAPGPHRHDGSDSELLLEGMTISGSRGGNVALVSIIACLVRLGATDSSTP